MKTLSRVESLRRKRSQGEGGAALLGLPASGSRDKFEQRRQGKPAGWKRGNSGCASLQRPLLGVGPGTTVQWVLHCRLRGCARRQWLEHQRGYADLVARVAEGAAVVSDPVEEVLELFRAHGDRITTSRRLLVRCLFGSTTHRTAEDLTAEV
jgi:hypothetical protein